jgi:atypical dual specificity phosphatase
MRIDRFGNELMDKFARVAPPSLVGFAGHILFWPIAGSQYLLSRLGLFQWYSEVHKSPNGGRILLGGIPWPESTRQKLLKDEEVSAVINLVSEKSFPFSVSKRIDVPLVDFAHPDKSTIEPAVKFLDKCVADGETVYVHCRAGKGRSATVVMCWLVSRMNMDPVTAQEYLTLRRPQILQSLKDRKVVREFYNK